jgi:hypothetical protein
VVELAKGFQRYRPGILRGDGFPHSRPESKLKELVTVYGILRSGLERAMHEDEPPPFLGSWPRVYAAVLAYLAILILTLYAVTRFLTY